ncbi:MAG: hypothetical protein ACTSYW_00505 [Candidatus Heimdallarchaeota archaeon]
MDVRVDVRKKEIVITENGNFSEKRYLDFKVSEKFWKNFVSRVIREYYSRSVKQGNRFLVNTKLVLN